MPPCKAWRSRPLPKQSPCKHSSGRDFRRVSEGFHNGFDKGCIWFLFRGMIEGVYTRVLWDFVGLQGLVSEFQKWYTSK